MANKIVKLQSNLERISGNVFLFLKKAAEIILSDIVEERIDGMKKVNGESMKQNEPSTIRAKELKGRKPANHPLWDSQTMRNPSKWQIIERSQTELWIQPGKEIAKRAFEVQGKGYSFFGVSLDAANKADLQIEKAIRAELEKGVI